MLTCLEIEILLLFIYRSVYLYFETKYTHLYYLKLGQLYKLEIL